LKAEEKYPLERLSYEKEAGAASEVSLRRDRLQELLFELESSEGNEEGNNNN